MGLMEIFQEAAVTITEAFDDVPETVTYTQDGVQTYDEETEEISDEDVTYSIEGFVFGTLSREDKSYFGETNILPGDVKAIYPYLNVSAEPKEGSTILRSNNKTFKIQGFKISAAKAVIILHLRAA